MITTRFSDFVQINPAYSLTKRAKYPFVPMEAVAPGRRYVDAQQVREFTGGGAKFTSGDTLFARITPCLENGKIAQFKAPEGQMGFGSTEFIVVRAREGVSDPGFVYYLCLTDIIRKPAEKSMSGASGRQRADVKVVRDIEFVPPSLPTQRKIADILTAYDDLIENNARRIKILEEMAQMIYREWFVHFRLPGHEQVAMVETELGLIPEGWEVRWFTDVIDVMSGGTPSTSTDDYWNGSIPWCTPRDMGSGWYVLNTERSITELGLSKCSSKLYPANTVFITARGTVGRCVLAGVPMAMSQTSYALSGRNDIPQEFVFLMTLEQVDVLRKGATGAVFDTIVVDTFRRLPICLPPIQLLGRFAELVAPMFSAHKNLQLRNSNLRRTRDLLLPKLVSGEVDLSGLQIDPVS